MSAIAAISLSRNCIEDLMDLLRVVLISPLPPQKSGEAPYAKHLINELVKSGKVDVTAISDPNADLLRVEGRDVATLRIWKGRSLFYPLLLLNRIRKIKPHIVHVQFGPYGKVYGGLFGEFMLLLLILLRAAGIRTTITLHSTWMPQQVTQRVRRYRKLGVFAPLAQALFRIYMRFLDAGTSTIQLSTVKLDSKLKDVFLRTYNISHQKVLEIPHPCAQLNIGPKKKDAAERLELGDRDVVLLFGFIRRGKGIDTAIRAINQVRRKLPKVLLLIAGRPQGFDSGNYFKEIKKITADLELEDNVRFDSRFIPDYEVPDYFAASSILLVPYTESVGASGPIHNYAGYGVPILASDVGYHNRDSLGGNLFLFKPGSVSDLARKLEKILTKPEETKEVQKRQIEYTQRENWKLAGQRTIRWYLKTLEN
ncbi:MAG: glycosyltransferase [Promethearchaeota archaeon]